MMCRAFHLQHVCFCPIKRFSHIATQVLLMQGQASECAVPLRPQLLCGMETNY
uniref:Uncharacterized protein n=1 Tax=Anguilla anguilla TaxID=7936 RepID=A0A0E9TR20_ANGAN